MKRGEAEGRLDNEIVVSSSSPTSTKSKKRANSGVGASSKSGIVGDAILSLGIVGSWLEGIIKFKDEIENLIRFEIKTGNWRCFWIQNCIGMGLEKVEIVDNLRR